LKSCRTNKSRTRFRCRWGQWCRA